MTRPQGIPVILRYEIRNDVTCTVGRNGIELQGGTEFIQPRHDAVDGHRHDAIQPQGVRKKGIRQKYPGKVIHRIIDS